VEWLVTGGATPSAATPDCHVEQAAICRANAR